MPSGHGASSGGGHFGGGHSSSSFGGGHFGGSRSSSSFGGGHFGGSRASFTPRPHRPFYQPRVVFFGGHHVYLDSGRASTVSVLGVLIAIAVIVTIFLAFGWLGSGNDVNEYQEEMNRIESDYDKYHKMAEYADEHSEYTTHGDVKYFEEYPGSGKYCIFYAFDTPNGRVEDGSSYYVYTKAEAEELKAYGVDLALEERHSISNRYTDSVPLGYKDTTLEDDAEYVYYRDLYNAAASEADDSKGFMRGAFLTSVGVTVGLVLLYVLVNATAKKATAEQIAADKQGTTASTDTKTTPAGTWRCEYCSTLNDNSKERCDGCGATRQK
ncbi:MAG: hypothetical protein KIG16_00195 [Eubacteriales bacterium]|nr:hypothetical protein [Eubacteriales bacterium]